MLAADAHLHARTLGSAPLDGQAHEIAHAVDIDRDERVLLEDALVQIGLQEAAGVVSADAEGGLGQVVGAEREELGALGQIAGPDGGARQLDHGADLVFHGDPGLGHHRLGDTICQGAQEIHLLALGYQRMHDLGRGRLARSIFFEF